MADEIERLAAELRREADAARAQATNDAADQNGGRAERLPMGNFGPRNTVYSGRWRNERDDSGSSRGNGDFATFRGAHRRRSSDDPQSSGGALRGRGRGRGDCDAPRGNFSPRGRGGYRGRGRGQGLDTLGRPWIKPKSWLEQDAADRVEPPWKDQRGELLAEISYESLLEEGTNSSEEDESVDVKRKKVKVPKFIDIDRRDVEFVASYNWIKKPDGDDASTVPTILVPGAPPLWKGPKEPVKVPDDNGEYFRDINKTRSPLYPLEPAIRALLTLKPNYPTESVDIFICASTVGKLLWICNKRPMNFRMDIEQIGNTIFFRRNEGSAGEVIKDVRGFGHNFADMHTDWDPTGQAELQGRGESHQRIVAYTFAGLRMLVRFESDGYLADKVDAAAVSEKAERRKSIHLDDNSADLLNLFNQLGIDDRKPAATTPPRRYATPSLPTYRKPSTSSESASSDSPPKPPSPPLSTKSSSSPESTELSLYSTPNLHIYRSFLTIPQSAVFDLKTRSIKRPIEMDEIFLRLWINRTPNFIVAYHRSGVFAPEGIEVVDVRDSVREWEKEHQPALERLERLLRDLVETCKVSGGEGRKRWELSRIIDGPLEIRRPWDGGKDGVDGEDGDSGNDGRSLLPEALRRRWADGTY